MSSGVSEAWSAMKEKSSCEKNSAKFMGVYFQRTHQYYGEIYGESDPFRDYKDFKVHQPMPSP